METYSIKKIPAYGSELQLAISDKSSDNDLIKLEKEINLIIKNTKPISGMKIREPYGEFYL